MFLLDTNICIYIIKKKPIQVLETFASFEYGSRRISSITVAELEYGVAKSIIPEKNRMALNKFLTPFEIIDFNSSHAVIYGEIRAYLERKGQIIGPHDLQIGAQALGNQLTLVTNNEREFNRIPGLAVANWV